MYSMDCAWALPTGHGRPSQRSNLCEVLDWTGNWGDRCLFLWRVATTQRQPGITSVALSFRRGTLPTLFITTYMYSIVPCSQLLAMLGWGHFLSNSCMYLGRQAGRQAGKHTMLQVCENCHSQECCFFRIVFTAFEHPALPRLVELRRCNMPRITMCCSVSAYQHGSCTPRPLTFGSLAGWSPRAGGANASPGQPDKKSLFISIIMGEQHTNSLVSRIHVQTLKVHC